MQLRSVGARLPYPSTLVEGTITEQSVKEDPTRLRATSLRRIARTGGRGRAF